MPMTYDVIVLGIGGMGSATVYELAKRGRKVLGFEQFNIGHEFGSSHGILPHHPARVCRRSPLCPLAAPRL